MPTSSSARSACSAIRWRAATLDRETLAGWETLIDNAHLFGTDMVSGFTGRIRGKPLTDSLPRFSEVWGELARRAADKGVSIAFENCAMDGNWATGDWNIAHNPGCLGADVQRAAATTISGSNGSPATSSST